jgi:hypothetical protein
MSEKIVFVGTHDAPVLAFFYHASIFMTFITNILHKKRNISQDRTDLLRLKEEIELCRIPKNRRQYKLNLGDHL